MRSTERNIATVNGVVVAGEGLMLRTRQSTRRVIVRCCHLNDRRATHIVLMRARDTAVAIDIVWFDEQQYVCMHDVWLGVARVEG